ncbi:MAG: hypothetical protein ACLQPD_32775 [Desulfomonilaceae bacterium]
MRGSEQARARIVQLIDEAESLDSLNLKAFQRWVQASYEALEFDPWQQQRFDEYCRLSSDTTSMRLFVGMWMLRLSLSS